MFIVNHCDIITISFLLRIYILLKINEGIGMENESVIDNVNKNINRYTLKCIKGMLIAAIVVWVLNLIGIFIIEPQIMAIGASVSITVCIITLLISKVIDLNKEWVKYFLLTSVLIVVTAMGIELTYHIIMLFVLPILLAAQYTDKKLLTYTYVLSLISMIVSALGGYFFGLCDANMLFLTKGPTAEYLDIVQNKMTFTNINPNPWYTVTLYFVVPRCIVLTLLIPIITGISKNIRQHEEFALNMKRLGERDEMTGVLNRNKFQNDVQEEYSKLDNIGIFFFDVNNLKWTNDNLGHDKGDELITSVGKLLLSLESENKKAYRIGGDEFILILENPKDEEAATLLKRFTELVDIKSKTIDVTLSVAYGYAQGKGTDIESIVEDADKEMYKMKQSQKRKKDETI